MVYNLTEEEESEVIKGETAEGLILICRDPNTDIVLKEKIINELFDRLEILEPMVQAIENRRFQYRVGRARYG